VSVVPDIELAVWLIVAVIPYWKNNREQFLNPLVKSVLLIFSAHGAQVLRQRACLLKIGVAQPSINEQ
jgi:hypothetical protein